MEERLRVKAIAGQFVDALEKNDMESMGELLAEDVCLESTNYGNAYGKNGVTAALKWQGLPIDYVRYKIFNFVGFTSGQRGKSSCVISALVGNDDPDYFHYFQWAGYCVMDYILQSGEWKIRKIIFQMDMEDGNTMYVRGWWKLIDYRHYGGTGLSLICSEDENPWNCFEKVDSWGSEEERVIDAIIRYAWGCDHGDFMLFGTCCANGLHAGLSKEQLINSYKGKRYKESNMEHIYKVQKVTIDGARAELTVYRYEPHRLGTAKLHKYNKDCDFYSGEYFYTLEKKEGNPYGGWQLTSMEIIRMKTFSESSYDQNKFFSEVRNGRG